MSSSSSPLARAALTAALLAVAACSDTGTAPPPLDPNSPQCQESALSYQNFAAPFVLNWCRGCHSKDQPAAMRQNAPLAVNFDTADEIRAGQARILARSTGDAPSMPPAGGPSEQERALLAEWLACGMK